MERFKPYFEKRSKEIDKKKEVVLQPAPCLSTKQQSREKLFDKKYLKTAFVMGEVLARKYY